MKFRTEIDIAPAPFGLNHKSSIFLTGSCFAEHIYERLSASKFNVSGNPFGILFNPMSIVRMIDELYSGKSYTPSDLSLASNGLWFSYSHHGRFSEVAADKVLDNINKSAYEGACALRKADIVIITFGTAWIFRLKETGETVANCHKQPSSLFTRERLTVGEITETYARLLSEEWSGKQVIFTVSPVRHLANGAEENSLSKATLRVAIGELTERYANAHYFPSFEILCDDLRDYRFYADDMMHPSRKAVDYVWQLFTEWCMDSRTRAVLPRIEKIMSAVNHRLIYAAGDNIKTFRDSVIKNIEAVEKDYPEVDLTSEKKYFDNL